MEEVSTEYFYSLDFTQLGDPNHVVMYALLEIICTERGCPYSNYLGTSRTACHT